MTGALTDMAAFVTALRSEVEPLLAVIHPSPRATIITWFCQMHDDLNDVHRVMHLMALVRSQLADELRWEAEKIETTCRPDDHPEDLVEAAELRRRADHFEVLQ
jgi:hypothetical protein